jgi:hypothetical protein
VKLLGVVTVGDDGDMKVVASHKNLLRGKYLREFFENVINSIICEMGDVVVMNSVRGSKWGFRSHWLCWWIRRCRDERRGSRGGGGR